MQDLGVAVEKLNSCLGSKKTKADTLEQDEIELLQLGKLFVVYQYHVRLSFSLPPMMADEILFNPDHNLVAIVVYVE